jgi:hypothetical protein
MDDRHRIAWFELSEIHCQGKQGTQKAQSIGVLHKGWDSKNPNSS